MARWTAILMAVMAAAIVAPASAQERREFKDCAECPTMVVVAPGRISRSDKLNFPEYSLEIRRPFAVSKFEVTWEQFDAFRDATGRDGKGCTWFSIAGDRPMPDKDWDEAFDPLIHIQEWDEPILCVSFEDAQAYVAWLREKTGEPYRLLSEAEWEYAARAGSPNDAAWWTTFNTPQFEMMNCGDCPGQDTMGREDWLFTFSAGRYPPNGFGLYDMGGNAAEWVEDCFNPTLEKAPRDGTAWLDGDCNRRIVRGGAWHDERLFLAGFREGWPVKTRINDIGFRIARSLPE